MNHCNGLLCAIFSAPRDYTVIIVVVYYTCWNMRDGSKEIQNLLLYE